MVSISIIIIISWQLQGPVTVMLLREFGRAAHLISMPRDAVRNLCWLAFESQSWYCTYLRGLSRHLLLVNSLLPSNVWINRRCPAGPLHKGRPIAEVITSL